MPCRSADPTRSLCHVQKHVLGALAEAWASLPTQLKVWLCPARALGLMRERSQAPWCSNRQQLLGSAITTEAPIHQSSCKLVTVHLVGAAYHKLLHPSWLAQTHCASGAGGARLAASLTSTPAAQQRMHTNHRLLAA